MIQLSSLIKLDVRNNSLIKNCLLESAMNLDHPIRILCIDTCVNTIEFEYKYPETVKEYIDFQHTMYKTKNLTFDCNPTLKVPETAGEVKVWGENGNYRLDYDSDSDKWDEFDTDNYYACNNNDDDYFFDEEDVPEMYNELGDDGVPEMYNELDEE